MKILRFVAICLNSIALLIGAFCLLRDTSGFDMYNIVVCLLISSPLSVSLIYILLMGDSSLSLYFQRKVAEERIRLAELKADNEGAKS
jgi:hypothetical protein